MKIHADGTVKIENKSTPVANIVVLSCTCPNGVMLSPDEAIAVAEDLLAAAKRALNRCHACGQQTARGGNTHDD